MNEIGSVEPHKPMYETSLLPAEKQQCHDTRRKKKKKNLFESIGGTRRKQRLHNKMLHSKKTRVN